MLKRFVLPVCLSIAAMSPAFAEDLVKWGTSGDWAIFRDPTHGNGCLVQAALSDGSYLRIGFEKKGEGKGYVSSFNPAWSKIEEGKKYDVTVTFGTQSFTGEGRGAMLDKMPGIVAKSDNIDMLVALANEKSVNLAIAGGAGLDVALNGSKDALTQALACQAE
jgi:hypothetical protein